MKLHLSDDDLKKIFSKNLRMLIDNSGKSQREVAKDLGISATTLNTWCTGGAIARISKIDAMANYFGVSRSDLLEDKSEDDSYYIDAEARDYAEFLFKNPEYRVLFSAARDIKKEDLEFVKDLLDRFKK